MSGPVTEKAAREREFHNEWAKRVDLNELLVSEAFEAPTAVENRYSLEVMGDLRGKKLLDLGCGAGETSVYFASKGAEVHACDISEEFLKLADRLAAKHGVSIRTLACDSAKLPFTDDSFDLVFGNGVLHHVDLEPTTREIARVLKPGGKAVFIEPLPYNPAINVYRKLAKGVRTEDETPLTMTQVRSVGRHFSKLEHREFWFITLLIFFHFFLVRRWNPSKVRYWKKVIEEGKAYEKLFGRLKRADDALLGALPFLRPLCWNTVIVATK